MGLYVIMGAIAIVLYSPTLTKQIASYEASGAATAEFAALSSRSRILSIVLAVIVVAIIVLMVVKPG